MGGTLVIGELGPLPSGSAVDDLGFGPPTRLTLELATLAASLSSDAAEDAAILLVGAGPEAALEVAAHGPSVLVTGAPPHDASVASGVAAIAAALIEERQPDLVLVGASPEGRDVAGLLVGLTDLPILVGAERLVRGEDGLVVEMATFGGRVRTASAFAAGRGIVLVGAAATVSTPAATVSTSAAPAAAPAAPVATVSAPAMASGPVRPYEPGSMARLPAVSVIERVGEVAQGPAIDDARVIVSAGRGVAGAEGLKLVTALAEALGGAVGATRAAVDAGWMDFAQQIGQTGKTVKPDLYVAVGVSGAIQHRVGMQSAGAIVAINKDPDAPIAEFADILVVGDLFEIVPLLTAAIRARGTRA
jgi:electron transfer flavoprotein alpha subunit